MTGSPVRHDEASHRFVAEIAGSEAYLQYRRIDQHTVDFRSTFVPATLRGRGLAEQIVRAGFAWAEAEGLRVIPSCSYVQRLSRQDPEFRALIAE